MSLLDKASLVVTPNAYKESKLYSVIPSDGSGDMTVVRATTGTRINSANLVEVVARNLFTNSNDFANASWLKQNTSVTANSIVSPDGTQNASKFIPNSTNAFHGIYSGATNYYSNNIFSVYAKKGEYNYLILQDQYSSAFYNIFNLDSGTIVSGTNGTITSVGNGWYRISVKFTAPAGLVYPTITIAPSTSASYLGDNTSGGYLYGAQIEQAITLTEYFPTTTRLNIPRIDYTNGSCPSLLVEPQRTNLQLNSEDFSNASWTKTLSAVVANQVASPSGNIDADKLNETATTGNHQLESSRNASIAAYSMSVFAKKAEREWLYLFEDTTGKGAYFNLNNGTIGTIAAGATAKIETFGNGWYRCSVTYNESGTFGRYRIAVTTGNGVTSYTGVANNGIYIWGAQYELGAYSTSYIPTVASSVTRNADNISKSGISSLIGTEFTLFFDGIESIVNASSRYLSLKGSGGTYANLILIEETTNNRIAITIYDNASSNIFGRISSSLTGGQRVKLAVRCKNNDFAFYVNGSLVGSQTSGTVPTFSALYLGYYTDYADNYNKINSAIIFNSALSNTELAQLTTL